MGLVFLWCRTACRNRSAGGYGIGYEVIMGFIMVFGYFKGEVVEFGVKGVRLSFLDLL